MIDYMSSNADPYDSSNRNGAQITGMNSYLRIGIAESSLFVDVEGSVG